MIPRNSHIRRSHDEKGLSEFAKNLLAQGVILKNCLYGTEVLPRFMQAQEKFPSENVIRYYAGLAKNGAAVCGLCAPVLCGG